MRLLARFLAALVAFLVVCSSLGSYLSLEDVVHNYLGYPRGGASNTTLSTGETLLHERANLELPPPPRLPVASEIQNDTDIELAQSGEMTNETIENALLQEQNHAEAGASGVEHKAATVPSDLEEDESVLSSWENLRPSKLWETFRAVKNNSTTDAAKKKRKFLDRMALVSNAMLKTEHDAVIDTTTLVQEESLHGITPQSDLTRPGRHMSVVTTAALPWFTGTAVNPLLRAAYLCRTTKEINANLSYDEKQWVTLVIPWLELREDRLELYGPNHVFETPQQQEDYIREWLAVQADMEDVADPETGLKIMFYPARYHDGLKSIFAMGDVCSLIPHRDVCILEEPEHLNWYRAPGEGWTKKFNYVVGIVHTNYREYASAHYSGLWTAPAIAALSSAMVRAYCHKVIKLSDVLQTFAPEKEETSNVHGVRSEFLKEGQRRALATTTLNSNHVDSDDQGESSDVTRVYFIGKILWAKGLDLLLELQRYCRQYTGEYFAIDIYGSGPELRDIQRAYHGRRVQEGKSKKVVNRATKRARRADKRDRRKKRTKQSSNIRILGVPFGIDSALTTLFPVKGVEVRGQEEVEDSLGGSLSLESTESDDESQSESDEYDSAVDETFNTTQQALDYLQLEARKKLEQIKDTIKSATESLELDLPKSFHELRRQPIPATFPGRVDHASIKEQHKVFVNPSITEVLCTTTAEALAMGKFVIVPVHPSNNFFLKFPNCLAYRNKWEFVANLKWALAHEPEPLTPELAHEFTWEAATERFIKASAITWEEARERERLGTTKLDERIAWFHNELGKGVKGDALRKVLGAGPASDQHRYEIERKQQQEAAAMKDSQSRDVFYAEEDGTRRGPDDDEDEEEGLPNKFRKSSFAEAIRSTVINGLPTMIS